MKCRLSEKARAARTRALGLMTLHGLLDAGWTFAFDRRALRMGACHFGPKKISLSIHHVEHDEPAVVMDTILHEIAHALRGPSADLHDEAWRQIATGLGADPDWKEGKPKPVPGRWQAVCPACGHVYHRYQDPAKSRILARGKTWCCRHCGSPKGLLTWREVASPSLPAAGAAKEEPKDSGSL